MEPARSPKRLCLHSEHLSTVKSTPAQKRWTHKWLTTALSVPCSPAHANDAAPIRSVYSHTRTQRELQSFSYFVVLHLNAQRNGNEASVQYSLEELARRTCCIRQICMLRNRFAKRCVPFVRARGPRQFVGERCVQIVDGPSNYCIIVHSHVNINQTNRITDTYVARGCCGKRETAWFTCAAGKG